MRLADHLRTARGFAHERKSMWETWYDRSHVRVVDEDGCVTVHCFTSDAAAVLEWSATFSPGAPLELVLAAVDAALAYPTLLDRESA